VGVDSRFVSHDLIKLDRSDDEVGGQNNVSNNMNQGNYE
jgi:hypothetical protein